MGFLTEQSNNYLLLGKEDLLCMEVEVRDRICIFTHTRTPFLYVAKAKIPPFMKQFLSRWLDRIWK